MEEYGQLATKIDTVKSVKFVGVDEYNSFNYSIEDEDGHTEKTGKFCIHSRDRLGSLTFYTLDRLDESEVRLCDQFQIMFSGDNQLIHINYPLTKNKTNKTYRVNKFTMQLIGKIDNTCNQIDRTKSLYTWVKT